MTIKKKDRASADKSRVKVGKLQVNKEIVEDLTDKQAEQIKGGAVPAGGSKRHCITKDCPTP